MRRGEIDISVLFQGLADWIELLQNKEKRPYLLILVLILAGLCCYAVFLTLNPPGKSFTDIAQFIFTPAPTRDISGYLLSDEPFVASPISPVELVLQIKVSPESSSGSWGLAIDKENNVYVQDTNQNRISKFDGNGNLILTWGSKGIGDGQFDFGPHFPEYGNITVDKENNILVADESFRLQKFDRNGKFLWKRGPYGQLDGSSISPEGLALDLQDNVYVTNFSGILKFDSDGKFQKTVNKERGTGIAIDKEGNMFVTDLAKTRIEKLSSTGNLLVSIINCGPNENMLMVPFGIALDTQGNVYTTDTDTSYKASAQVCKFDNAGNFIARWSIKLPGDVRGHQPFGIAVDSKNNVYVADYWQHRILKFRQK